MRSERCFRRCFPLLLLLLLFPLVVEPASAQKRRSRTKGVAIVMTRETGYTDQYWAATADLAGGRFLQAPLANGFHVTNLIGTGASWIAICTKGAPFFGQEAGGYRLNPRGPSQQFAGERGQRMTSLAFNDGQWVGVTSEGSDYGAQNLVGGDSLPIDKIEAGRKQGYAVTNLVYGDGGWIALLTQGTKYTSQIIIRAPQFPTADVDARMKDGFAITDAAYGDDEWVVVMSAGTGWGKQIYMVDSLWDENQVKKFVDEGWMASYHITEIVNNALWPSFGSANNGKIADYLVKQATPQTASWYESFIRASAPTEDAFVAVQRLAGYPVERKQWKEAADIYRRFKPLFPDLARRFDKTIAMLERSEDTIVARPLGRTVNTSSGEYVPVPTADGSTLYFTSPDRPDGVGQEDIFYTTRTAQGEWGKVANLRQLNTGGSEAVTSASADGNRLTVYADRSGRNGGDLYYSDRTPTGWSPIQPYPKQINTPFWDCDGFITSDGKAMLFASDRPGGIGRYHMKDRYYHGESWGNLDIYVSLKTPTGWSEPINLGANINTPFADRTPFLHPDGKTLYFSSSGREGLGTLDVFKSTRLREDSWTEWSEPVHLGKQLNTIGSDWGYRVTTDGVTAYFATGNAIGRSTTEDIYSVTLPSAVRPDPVATIHGRVTDPDGKPLIADVKWEDLRVGKNVGELKTNPQDGTYFITLPLGKNYGYFAEKSGYYPASKNIDLRGKKESVNLTVDIVLVPIKDLAEKGTAVRINNVFFDVDMAELKPESRVELDRLMDLIAQFPKSRIEIAGHTDNQASDSYNVELSQRRAQAVVDYLVTKGVERSRFVPKGYGEKKPLATNETEEGRALNRRVEFRFLKK